MKKLFLLYLITFGNLVQSLAQNLDVRIVGSGPNIILIPGLASSGHVWDETVRQLSENFECHVLTLPGFAENPASDLSGGFLNAMEGLVSDYILRQNKSVVLIGHSLGGFLSLKLSRSLPDRVEKAIIVDSFPFYSLAFNPTATEENMVEMASRMKEMMISASSDQYQTQQQATMSTMVTNSEKLQLAVEWSLQSDRNTTALAFYELLTTDFRDELADIETPLLVLGAWYAGKNHGITETSAKRTFENQYKLAKTVQIEMAPTAHHFIMWDNPEWFMEKVTQFLQ